MTEMQYWRWHCERMMNWWWLGANDSAGYKSQNWKEKGKRKSAGVRYDIGSNLPKVIRSLHPPEIMSWLTYKSRIFINSMQVLQPEIMEMNISRDTFTYHCHHKTTSWMRAWWLHQHQSHVADDSSSSSLSDTYLLALALAGETPTIIFFLNWTPKSCAGFKLCRAYVASYALGCITRGIFFNNA